MNSKSDQDEMKVKLQQQEERLTMLDRKSIAAGRPALSTTADEGAPHQKAIAAYLRSGDDDGLRGLPVESKALNTQVSADGGYLINPEMAERISGRAALDGIGAGGGECGEYRGEFLRCGDRPDRYRLGLGDGTGGADRDFADLLWSGSRSSCLSCRRCRKPRRGCWMMRRLMSKAGWPERIANRFARAEAGAFVSGDGVDKPKGFLADNKITNGSWVWGQLGYVPTGNAGDFATTNASDAIVDLVDALGGIPGERDVPGRTPAWLAPCARWRMPTGGSCGRTGWLWASRRG